MELRDQTQLKTGSYFCADPKFQSQFSSLFDNILAMNLRIPVIVII